jgi:hypothetical protein
MGQDSSKQADARRKAILKDAHTYADWYATVANEVAGKAEHLDEFIGSTAALIDCAAEVATYLHENRPANLPILAEDPAVRVVATAKKVRDASAAKVKVEKTKARAAASEAKEFADEANRTATYAISDANAATDETNRDRIYTDAISATIAARDSADNKRKEASTAFDAIRITNEEALKAIRAAKDAVDGTLAAFDGAEIEARDADDIPLAEAIAAITREARNRLQNTFKGSW